MKDRPTIDDVARRAGVSKATVSAVLNDRDSVATGTRSRVRSVIEELNYRPRYVGGRQGRRRHRSAGLLVKEIENPYYTEIAGGMSAGARHHGYTLLIASSEGDGAGEREAIEVLQAQGASGIIATPVSHDEGGTDLSHLFELKRRNVPFVLLERVRGLQAPVVDIDNAEASREAVEYLIGTGHEAIVHFAGPAYSLHSEERVAGVRRAFSSAALSLPDDAVVPAGASIEEGHRAALDYFRDRPADRRPTAVTCYNDLVALGVCRALRDLDLSVPDDVSVVGFDDLDILAHTGLALTTVSVPTARMGSRALDMLVERIESPVGLAPESVVFAAGLVVRGSTAPRSGGRP